MTWTLPVVGLSTRSATDAPAAARFAVEVALRMLCVLAPLLPVLQGCGHCAAEPDKEGTEVPRGHPC